MSTAIETTILEQLHLLDEDHKAEVLDFIQFLITKSKANSSSAKVTNEFDPMRYSGTVLGPVDGLAYQELLRSEWE